jgi:hypothetical protein
LADADTDVRFITRGRYLDIDPESIAQSALPRVLYCVWLIHFPYFEYLYLKIIEL